MSHPFGDRLTQHLHQKHGLSQKKLAEGIHQDPAVITAMCQGKRLQGPGARQRVLAIIAWLHEHDVLHSLKEANALLEAAGLAPLQPTQPEEVRLLQRLAPQQDTSEPQFATSDPHKEMSLVPHPVAQPSQLILSEPLALQRPEAAVPGDDLRSRKAGNKRTLGVLVLIGMSVAVGLAIWSMRSQERPIWQEAFNPLLPTRWKQIQHSAVWEDVPGQGALLRENDPRADFSKVETQSIVISTHRDPILHISVVSIDEHTSYTVQIRDLYTGREQDVLKGVTYTGEQFVPLNAAMGWSGQDAQPFTINIWISGEGRAATFSLVEVMQ